MSCQASCYSRQPVVTTYVQHQGHIQSDETGTHPLNAANIRQCRLPLIHIFTASVPKIPYHFCPWTPVTTLGDFRSQDPVAGTSCSPSP